VPYDVAKVRAHFPALAEGVAHFDGPAGSQVPDVVADAVAGTLLSGLCNRGTVTAAEIRAEHIVASARQAAADLLGAQPNGIIFGRSMTQLTYDFSRALAKTWSPGDEVIVTRLDHDANVSPWTRAAHDRGVAVQQVNLRLEDCTLDLEDLIRKLTPKTKLVAIGGVSNAVGTRNPVERIVQMAHEVGALVFVDAVHQAPHLLIDVMKWNCDFLACSAYKFFGSHVGIVWARRELLEDLPAYKVRPCPETLPDRWMTGTQNFASIAGVRAAVNYLAQLGSQVTPAPDRRSRLKAVFDQIEEYEQYLSRKLIEGLSSIDGVQIHGITDLRRLHDRVPTVSFTHQWKTPHEIALYLGERGIFVWHGNYYALPLTEALGVEPHGMVRVGAMHYNTPAEVDRLVATLREMK
jgi:cysteine desulfurase family protein (TIGR01976 family)